MTQEPTKDAVVGRFDGREVSYESQSARPFEKDGRFKMDLPTESGRRTAEVALAVGSHRYQQYFEKIRSADGFHLRRLPILWHIGERRWLHINTVFLGPDDANWNAHASTWNSNCIFCHTTGPEPRLIGDPRKATRDHAAWDSKTAELGISCESCHGPGRAHAEAEEAAKARGETHDGDPMIVDPHELDGERSAAVCGQCHGQRMPKDPAAINEWIVKGPSFRPGMKLLDHVTPIAATTPSIVANDPDLFSKRFWKDGTPRLSAYEFQGWNASPCRKDAKFSCGSCHTMHGGDPKGMIEPKMRGPLGCVQCHQEIGRDIAAHTHHGANSPGSNCYECHMPRIAYGILELHRSHRIEIPAPARHSEKFGRPNACGLCHVDRTIAWLEGKTRELWTSPKNAPSADIPPGNATDRDAIKDLLTGDTPTRAVIAQALAADGVVIARESEAARRIALIASCGDAYPAVRRIARRALLLLESKESFGLTDTLLAFDPSDAAQRAATIGRLFDVFATTAPKLLPIPAAESSIVQTDFRPKLANLQALLNLQPAGAVSIGE